MDTCVLGVIISREEYDEYIKLKQKKYTNEKEKDTWTKKSSLPIMQLRCR